MRGRIGPHSVTVVVYITRRKSLVCVGETHPDMRQEGHQVASENNSPNRKRERAIEVYDKTNSLAVANAWAQGLSGIAGSGFNLLVDAGVIPFYVGLWNNIRKIYGKGEITLHAAGEYLKPNLGFLVQDLVWDKLVGSVPVIGAPLNAAFGKALTWRLGAWFGMLSALGEESDNSKAITTSTMGLARDTFPSEGSAFSWKSPDKEVFVSFIASVDGLSCQEVQKRADQAVKALRREL